MRRHSDFPVHSGIVPTLMAFNPLSKPPYLPPNGIPLGFMDNGQPFCLNLAELADRDFINTPNMVFLGKQGSGKTTLAIMTARGLVTLKERPRDSEASFRTGWSDDSKAHEYEPLATYFGCTSLRMQDRRINPLSSEMSLADQSFICRLIISQADGELVLPDDQNALDAGLEAVRDSNIAPSFQELANVLNRQESLRPPRLHDDTDERVNIPNEEFQERCRHMTVRISNMLRGAYGQIFGHGTDQTVTELLKQRFVNVDYSGMSEEVVRIVQTLFWMRKKINMPNVNIYDEAYGLLRHPEFSKPLHDAMKTNRAARKTVILITHGLRDFASLPGEASKLAMSLTQEAPIWITGQLEAADVADLQDLRKFNNKVRSMIQQLKATEFVAFIGQDTEPFKFRSFVPARMLDITFTNQALAAELGRSTR